MRVTLSAPYADVRAADLVLELDVPAVLPLEQLDARLGAFALQLGVLGHSHQVVARWGGERLTERVACRPGAAGDLPPARQVDRTTHRYAFRAEVGRLDDRRAVALARAIAADDRGIVGVFAGADAAFTGLRAATIPGGVRWETWHAYPQTGELVATTGTVIAT